MPEVDLPVVIADDETIVRAIKTPAHYDEKKNRLKPGAFRPPPGERVASVMRQLIGDDTCKAKAIEICGPAYRGVAVIQASDIRSVGATVTDTREEWFGHADLDIGLVVPIPTDDPPAPEILAVITERCRALKDRSSFREDADRNSHAWGGKPLRL